MENTLGLEILYMAIHQEIQANEFYTKMASRVESKKGRKMLLKLAEEENSHRDSLSKRFLTLFGKPFTPDPDPLGNENLKNFEEAVFTRTSQLEAVSIGIGMEKEAAAFYSAMMDETDVAADLKLVKKLYKFELGHVNKLQNLYARLEKKGAW